MIHGKMVVFLRRLVIHGLFIDYEFALRWQMRIYHNLPSDSKIELFWDNNKTPYRVELDVIQYK
jgi:hypothetical protein